MNPKRLLWCFIIPALPIAKGRARATIRRGKGGKPILTKTGQPIIANFTPVKTRNFEALVADMAANAVGGPGTELNTGPIDLLVEFRMPMPDSWPAWKRELAVQGLIHHTGKPDCSNLVKAIEDACNAVLFHDDSQIVGLAVDKTYTSGAPCIVVNGFQRAGYANNCLKRDTMNRAEFATEDRRPLTQRLLTKEA